jgi:hypothetical protein
MGRVKRIGEKTELSTTERGSTRRTQFMQRLVDFVQSSHLTVRLAYYPPYPSQI